MKKPYPEYVFKPDKTDKKHFLGNGAFGSVYRGFALERDYEEVAVKLISLQKLKAGASQGEDASIDKEIQAFKRMKSMFKTPPINCLEIFDVFRSRSNLYVVMMMCRDGDLEKLLKKKKRFTEKEATNCLIQLVNGLREMHEINMLHRDMKPANVFIEDGQYLIGDYGLSTVAIHNPNAM